MCCAGKHRQHPLALSPSPQRLRPPPNIEKPRRRTIHALSLLERVGARSDPWALMPDPNLGANSFLSLTRICHSALAPPRADSRMSPGESGTLPERDRFKPLSTFPLPNRSSQEISQ